MFDRLQKKWKVNGWQLFLVLCTFALGGSLAGFAAKQAMSIFPLEKGALWITIYIVVVTIIWPFSVLLISIPFGQFRFFISYLRKMGERMKLIQKKPE